MTETNADSDSSDRFTNSTDLKFGVVEDEFPEENIFRPDENPVFVTQLDEDREYWLRIGSRVDLDASIMFDSVRWRPGDFAGTLWFVREVGDEEVTVGNIEHWHPATPMDKLGLVGEWLAERIDLSEYRAGIECPECGSEILHIGMHSTCENVDCEFYCEGHLPEDWQESQEGSA